MQRARQKLGPRTQAAQAGQYFFPSQNSRASRIAPASSFRSEPAWRNPEQFKTPEPARNSRLRATSGGICRLTTERNAPQHKL